MLAVIMAGGAGTRFWPASRERRPKQFLPITGRRTMLEETVARARAFTDDDRIFLVINSQHLEITRELIGDTRINVLVEPVGRNTAPCIGLAAVHAARKNEDEPMIVMPADHYIDDLEAFVSVVRAAEEIARSGAIATIGIAPTRPETGYGYIETGSDERTARGRTHLDVMSFVEKPALDVALGFLGGGRHLWNGGIFAFTPATILKELAAHLPNLQASLDRISKAIDSEHYQDVLEREYRALASVSIDHGVMEHTEIEVRVLKVDFAWSDVGSWRAVYDLRKDDADESGNLSIGDVAKIDSRGNLVYSDSGRCVALLGVEGLAVIDTPDAVLICDLERSQDVRKIIDELNKTDRVKLK